MSVPDTNNDRISIPLMLAFPVVAINTFEMSRAIQVVGSAAKERKKTFESMPFKQVPSPDYIKNLAGKADKNGRGTVIFDQYFFDRSKANPENLPSLKASLATIEELGVTYVIAGRDALSEEFVYHIDLPPMDQQEVIDVLLSAERDVQFASESLAGRADMTPTIFSDAERAIIANHAMGLSHSQMRNVFIYSAYLKRKGHGYLGEIRREKNHILRDVGLDVLEPVAIDTVGGLGPLKEFLNIRKAGWEKNLSVKGLLLAGVPGGGKTLMAKAAAGVFGTTLVRLDMGRFYSKYLGETEAKFTRALQTVEQIAPVVVLIDEIEKFFGSSEGEHEVSKRLLGTFLYWLQERKGKIFIVASANRVSQLPPELMRAGRWDRCFFIDLPSIEERSSIFQIHINKAKANPAEFNLPALIEGSDGYTGVEIEQAVVDALYIANAKDTALSQEILLAALGDITPTSVTRKADIDSIRRLGDQGFYPANTYDEVPGSTMGRQLSVD